MSESVANPEIPQALLKLDAWLDTIRGPGGYGGPVAHWWRQSLLYTGPSLDWRYEGLISGYLDLWQASGGRTWLAKARRAGDDLIAGQLPDGHFQASAFEINPASGGTPHEAACDAGMLRLALALKKAGEPGWEAYAACAKKNLESYYIEKLWDSDRQTFRDSPGQAAYVPNKIATACEAFILLAELEGEACWVEEYALPALELILSHQLKDGGTLDGAIAQNSFGRRIVEKYFPLYIARCIPGLLDAYAWGGDERFLEAARRALAFVLRLRLPDGSFPQVVYPKEKVNCYPQWIGGVGDILLAGTRLRDLGEPVDMEPTQLWMLAGQLSSGGFRTAHGFGSLISQRPPGEIPDFRDLLPVAGWNDKAFRYLASLVVRGNALGSLLDSAIAWAGDFESNCTFSDHMMLFRETPKVLEAVQSSRTVYHWEKGDAWARTEGALFWRN